MNFIEGESSEAIKSWGNGTEEVLNGMNAMNGCSGNEGLTFARAEQLKRSF